MTMKPGDLLRPFRAGWCAATLQKTAHLDVWSDDFSWAGKWQHDQVGILLTGRRQIGEGSGDPNGYVLIEVLLNGRTVWAVEEDVEVINETR